MIDLRRLPDPLPIRPLTRPLDVTITPPGSKSITCRAYVLAALAAGESKIIRPLRADDTEYLLNALCTLGAEARWVPGETHDGEDVCIKGVAGRFPRGGHVYLGDGGTPTRFMIACACLAAEPVVVDASPRMRQRPIAEGVDMLRQLGARIEYVEEEGRSPVRVVPSESFRGGALAIAGTQSSQSISAVLLVAPWLSRGVELTSDRYPTSYLYLFLTTSVLDTWGADLDQNPPKMPFRIAVAPRSISSRRVVIESDASSAVYWGAVVALLRRSQVRIHGLPSQSLQPDIIAFRQVITLAVIEETAHTTQDMRIRWYRELPGFRRDASLFPDGAVAACVIAAAAKGCSRITGLRTLRVKETDRIAALANELRKVGCTIESGEDWIEITPPPPKTSPAPKGEETRANQMDAGSDEPARKSRIDASPGEDPVIIETYNDHRMAMSFAVLGLARPGIAIRNPACVSKSYPTFWDDFLKLYPPDDQPPELLAAMRSG